MPKEELLQFIWKFGLFDKENLITSDNKKVEVLSLGTHNTNAGPDFLNAKLKIDDIIWVGNVELHPRSSDWMRHRHSINKAYGNVILHVVGENDVPIDIDGHVVPVAELMYDSLLEQRFLELMQSEARLTCHPFVHEVSLFQLRLFLSRVLAERLETKSAWLHSILNETNNDWREAFHRMLFRSFGFSVNATPFELLAQQIPTTAIDKHRDSLPQLEAMLFGVAGFLEEEPLDDYQRLLTKEFTLLKEKFQLKPLEQHIWKFSRLRPLNFPTIRIAQLAYLLHTTEDIMEKILLFEKLDDYFWVLSCQTSEYWESHYTFGKAAPLQKKALGKPSIERILTNAIIPYVFCYGAERKKERLQEKALNMLEQLPPEHNASLEKWKEIGVRAENAFFSQALLQLKSSYCDKKRCLSCIIGKQMLIRK